MNLTRRTGVIALVSGALAATGHAPFGLWPLALAGFAVLIWMVAKTSRPAVVAWIGGFGYFAVAMHWIVQPFLVDAASHGWMAPFALILLAGGLAIFWGAAGWVSARLRWPALGFSVGLSLAELGRGYLLTGFPWALPAYVWADTPVRMLASLFGPYGLTLVTLIALSIPGLAKRAATGVGAACLLLAVLWGLGWTLLDVKGTGSAGIVRLVQPNAPQHEKWDPEKAPKFVARAIKFTAEPKEFVDLVVWPESAIPRPLDLAGPVLSRAGQAAGEATLITGINRRTANGEYFNALVRVDPGGVIGDVYDKVHLVPFGEYIPLRIDLLRAMAGFSGFGFSAGAGVRLVETPLGKALPLICYEAIFPRHGASLDERPDYLLQITNDAWFGTFSGPFQHLDQARFRAVEQGLPFIRAANTGVSAVISPNGIVLGSLDLGTAGYLDVTMPKRRFDPTLYSRIGDLPFGVIEILTLIALFGANRRNTIANRPSRA